MNNTNSHENKLAEQKQDVDLLDFANTNKKLELLRGLFHLICENNQEMELKFGGFYKKDDFEKQDINTVAEYFKIAAESGFAGAQNALGIIYLGGLGVCQDYYKASVWFKKAKTKDSSTPVRQNFDYIEMYFKTAAENGFSDVQNTLGIMYLHGFCVRQNRHRSLMWFKKAASREHPQATYYLGYIHYYGLGIKKNIEEAIKWFTSAAIQGSIEAKLQLCSMKLQGEMHY